MYSVLISSNSFGLAEERQDLINKFHDHNIEPYFDMVENDPEILASIDGLLVGTSQITAEVIDKMKSARVIVKYGIGIDNINKEYAKKRGIEVKNLPGINSKAVAEFTVGMMFSVARKITLGNRNILAGEFTKVIGHSVLNNTVGIIGTGSIGKNVAAICRKLGMTVKACDVFEDKEWAVSNEVEYVDLEFLLSDSDFVTVHVPLNEQTWNLIDDREISLMKESAYLLNISRGGIVNESALYHALSSDRLAGAALDVFSKEPPEDSPLIKLKNIVATPHIAALTYETLINMDDESIRVISSCLT